MSTMTMTTVALRVTKAWYLSPPPPPPAPPAPCDGLHRELPVGAPPPDARHGITVRLEPGPFVLTLWVCDACAAALPAA